MRIAHLADLHFKAEAYDLCKASIDTLLAEHAREPFDLIVIAGDIWDGPIQDSGRARFDDFLALIRRLADCAPVMMVYGFRHDMVGSLEVFETQRARYPIKILRPGLPYFLSGETGNIYENKLVDEPNQFLLFGVPEPTKEWLLANAGASGKDASDQEIRDSMRALLLGLGGLRRQHPELPCVLLYHGDVYGATTSVGYSTANGTGIAVSRDDLAAVGFDYGAFGHIHLPQQVQGLPAYYSGKIYTGDWDERDYVPGANIVEIRETAPPPEAAAFIRGERRTEVTRLDFPHPQRIKVPVGDGDPVFDAEVKGKLAWIEITLSKEKAEGLDTDGVLAQMLTFGALEGSRVTLKVLPTETVRAGEIVEKKTLREKLIVYGEASETPMPESALVKADELEREAAFDGYSANGRKWRTLTTDIRGSWGLWYTQQKDEVFIDWRAAGPGVLGFIGPNGNGKTTIFDFSKPWAEAVTRPPKTIKDHFRLKDSWIINEYLDEISGEVLRSRMLINGETESGGVEYFLERNQGSGFLPYPGVNGRKDPYVQAVNELFGPLELYLKTAYTMQSGTDDYPSIKKCTKGQKKQLFNSLSGTDRIDRYRVASKLRADALDTEVLRLDATIAAGADIDGLLERITAEKAEAERTIQDAEMAAAEITKAVDLLAAEREALVLRVTDLDRQVERSRKLDAEIEEIDRTLSAIEIEIQGFSQAAEGRAAAEAELEHIKGLEARRAELLTEKAKIDEENRRTAEEYQRTTIELRRKQDEARTTLDRARSKLAEAEKAEALCKARLDPEAEGKLEAARAELRACEAATTAAGQVATRASAELERLRKVHAETKALATLADDLHEGESCPLCGGIDHPAPTHTDAEKLHTLEGEGKAAQLRSTQASAAILEVSRAEERARSTLQALEKSALEAQAAQESLVRLSAESQVARGAVDAAQAVLDAIQIPPPPASAPFPGATDLTEVEAAFEWTDKAGTEGAIQAARDAAVRIEGANRRKTDALARKASLVEERNGIAPDDGRVRAALTAKDSQLQDARDHLSEAQGAAAAGRATAQAKAEAIADALVRKAERDRALADRAIKAYELSDWRLLEKATGPDGIQALELDALAPSIAEVANSFFEKSGSNDRIRFDTTRIGGKGKDRKQIEDFLIWVSGNNPKEREIAKLSGGEEVWINRVLCDAFATIRARSAQVQFSTAWIDEADGALDADAKMAYFRIIEASLKESGRYQVVMVTHSRELQAMVERTIDVTKLGPRAQVSEGGIAA